MTREGFIKKWLGNKNFQYCEEHKELMREDLDSVIDYHQQQVKSVDLADVVEPEGKYCNNPEHDIEPKMICRICDLEITEDP